MNRLNTSLGERDREISSLREKAEGDVWRLEELQEEVDSYKEDLKNLTADKKVSCAFEV